MKVLEETIETKKSNKKKIFCKLKEKEWMIWIFFLVFILKVKTNSTIKKKLLHILWILKIRMRMWILFSITLTPIKWLQGIILYVNRAVPMQKSNNNAAINIIFLEMKEFFCDLGTFEKIILNSCSMNK